MKDGQIINTCNTILVEYKYSTANEIDRGVAATYKSCLDEYFSNSMYSYHVISKDISAKAIGTRPNFEQVCKQNLKLQRVHYHLLLGPIGWIFTTLDSMWKSITKSRIRKKQLNG